MHKKMPIVNFQSQTKHSITARLPIVSESHTKHSITARLPIVIDPQTKHSITARLQVKKVSPFQKASKTTI
jgi:hypothetical protein